MVTCMFVLFLRAEDLDSFIYTLEVRGWRIHNLDCLDIKVTLVHAFGIVQSTLKSWHIFQKAPSET